jgi:predicted CopG family antitoxin
MRAYKNARLSVEAWEKLFNEKKKRRKHSVSELIEELL